MINHFDNSINISMTNENCSITNSPQALHNYSIEAQQNKMVRSMSQNGATRDKHNSSFIQNHLNASNQKSGPTIPKIDLTKVIPNFSKKQ